MSKIGNKLIPVPASVQITINPGLVVVKGQKGEISISYPNNLQVEKGQDGLSVKRNSDTKYNKSLHGLYRSLIANAVTGVDNAWEKRLEIVGTGFNVKLQGEDLVFKVGYSHPVVFKKVAGLTYKVEGNNKVIVSGADKQLVGEIAYQIRIIKQPDAYKGKGIRFEGEHIKLKPGKKAKAA